jgi:hypothetical protein
MKHTRAKYHSYEKEQSNSGVQYVTDNSEKLRFTDGAGEGKNASNEVEFSNLQPTLAWSLVLIYDILTFVGKGKILLKNPTIA